MSNTQHECKGQFIKSKFASWMVKRAISPFEKLSSIQTVISPCHDSSIDHSAKYSCTGIMELSWQGDRTVWFG